MVTRSFIALLTFIALVACASSDAGDAAPPGDAGVEAGEEAGTDAASEDAAPSDASACAVPLPAGACTEGDLHCTSSDKECPGEQYRCEAGDWQKDDLNEPCKMLGHDFAFGCAFDSQVGGVLLICGNCDAGADACAP
jgi:hypothetical protein